MSENSVPIGSPAFHIRNVLSLTIITGMMCFFMLSVYYLTYEAPNPIKDLQVMLKDDGSRYDINEEVLTSAYLSHLPANEQTELKPIFDNGNIQTFVVTDKSTGVYDMTIYKLSAGGFGGLVTGLVGIGSNSTIKFLSITDASSETAGLGQKITEKGFQRQFLGKTEEQLPLDRVEWSQKSMDGVSGATFSSQSVVDIAVNAFKLAAAGGNDEQK